MIKLQSLTLRRGPEPLLENADALVHAGQRVAVVGANGAGKTSLFKLILGQLTPDAGECILPGKIQIAHMAQEVSAIDREARDFVLDGHGPLRELEQSLARAEAQDDHIKMAEIHGELEAIHAYELPARAEKLLHGLGFKQSDMNRAVNDFSGGWRIRLNLAQALMQPSDLLLLDEPTNHLDLDAILWLEDWLRRYEGTVLLISHDRDFIDAIATHVLQFEHKQLHQYTGGYSDFEQQRAEKLLQQQAAYEKQQQRIGEIQAFVTRFKAKATKARQAQSRIKELDRMERIAPAHVDSPFDFRFPEAEKISNPLLNMRHADMGYGNTTLLHDFSTSILPGTRVGLLGPNGAGKSTLVKSLLGELSLLSGERATGEHLNIGYFAQHQLESLDLKASPFLHLQRLTPKASDQSIRNFLGGFDFRGDKALDTIASFSGGEKARLALAMIAWQRPNLLLLDEPTNHLDLEMRHALTVALQMFEGAIILVSHDRHLLKNTVDQFWLVAAGSVAVFDGDLSDYYRWLQDYQKKDQESQSDSSESSSASQAVEPEKTDNESANERKERKRIAAENRKKISPLKKKMKAAENRMGELQTSLTDIEEQLADPDLYENSEKDQLKMLLQQQAEKREALDQLEESWCFLVEEIESIEALLIND